MFFKWKKKTTKEKRNLVTFEGDSVAGGICTIEGQMNNLYKEK